MWGIFPPETLELLQTIISKEYEVVPLSIEPERPVPINYDLLKTEDPVSEEYFRAIENGGNIGLERIVGAILETGQHRLELLCVEVYHRDSLFDPHAESQKVHPTSLPTVGPATQYKGRLKIVHIPNQYNNMKLVLGTRSHDYLITSGLYQQEALVGLGRCSRFPVNHTIRIYIRKKLQDMNMLRDDTVL
ncbi:hypothetical protein BGZ46_006288 [Entomortierella lignicola]|nr:hypothetical protein BGZ46_006288 [Entomortierella lignicola]